MTTTATRVCEVCGSSLTHHRSDATYCGPPCRIEASRRRRLRAGRVVDGYTDLDSYAGRRRRTNSGVELREAV